MAVAAKEKYESICLRNSIYIYSRSLVRLKYFESYLYSSKGKMEGSCTFNLFLGTPISVTASLGYLVGGCCK